MTDYEKMKRYEEQLQSIYTSLGKTSIWQTIRRWSVCGPT